MINTPNFLEKNIISFLFTPFSIIYLFGLRIYELLNDEIDIKIPVICVGNLVVGGSENSSYNRTEKINR